MTGTRNIPLSREKREKLAMIRRTGCSLLVTAAVLATLLSGCAGGGESPKPQETIRALDGVPANHGLQPGDSFTVGAGQAEDRGNVTIHCPADASSCMIAVAADGSVGYDPAGGVPAVTPRAQVPDEIPEAVADILNRRLWASTYPSARSFGGAFATCAALGCPVIDAIHIDRTPIDAGPPNLEGFEQVASRRGIALARKDTTSGAGGNRTSHRALGAWMDHGFFVIETSTMSAYDGFIYNTFWFGDATDTGPVTSAGATATWSGIMSGVETSPAGDAGAFVHGDAAVTVNGLDAKGGSWIDVVFSKIVNEDTGAVIADMAWRGLSLQARSFGTDDVLFHDGTGYFRKENFGTASDGSIFGHFYGPEHEEVGGLFHRDGIAGAFAAKRDG